MNGLSFQERHQWRGHWWVPGVSPRLPGVLTFGPDATLTLELVGILPSRTIEQVATGVYGAGVDSRSGTYDVIHGEIGGRAVTLLDCVLQRSRSGPAAGITGSTAGETDITATTALLGVHLSGASDLAFSGIEARIEGLTAWTGQSALTMSRPAGQQVEDITAQLPERQVAALAEDRYTLDHWLHGFNPRHRADGTSVDVRHEVRLGVQASTPRSLEDLRSRIALILDLVSLARRAPTAVLGVRLKLVEAEARGLCVDVLWRQRLTGSGENVGCTFTAADLGFQALLDSWTSKEPQLRSAIHLLQASWQTGGYLESDVLALATAIESYSSTLGLPDKLSHEQAMKLEDAARLECPVELRASLAGVLANFNRPSLRTRVDAVAGRVPSEVAKRLLPDQSEWARTMVRTRHELSHSGRTTLGFEKLASLRQVNSAVLYFVLLREVGLDEERLLEVLLSDSYLSHACARSAKHFVSAG